MNRRALVKTLWLSLLVGLAAFIAAVALAVLGFGLNPYLTWFGLWVAGNAILTWRMTPQLREGDD